MRLTGGVWFPTTKDLLRLKVLRFFWNHSSIWRTRRSEPNNDWREPPSAQQSRRIRHISTNALYKLEKSRNLGFRKFWPICGRSEARYRQRVELAWSMFSGYSRRCFWATRPVFRCKALVVEPGSWSMMTCFFWFWFWLWFWFCLWWIVGLTHLLYSPSLS